MNNVLTNILEIYRLVVQERYTIVEAAREVGTKNNIKHSDLLSSSIEALNISADTFNRFLESENAFNFKNFLIRRFPANQSQVIRFFNSFEDTSDIPIIDFTKIIKSSPHSEKKRYINNAIWISLKEDFQDWIARDDIPQDMKDVLKDWVIKLEDYNK